MARRQRDWADRGRKALIQELGGKCAICGTRENLEINHVFGRDYNIREMDQSMRLTRYRREARLGLVNVLCKSHNVSESRKAWDADLSKVF